MIPDKLVLDVIYQLKTNDEEIQGTLDQIYENFRKNRKPVDWSLFIDTLRSCTTSVKLENLFRNIKVILEKPKTVKEKLGAINVTMQTINDPEVRKTVTLDTYIDLILLFWKHFPKAMDYISQTTFPALRVTKDRLFDELYQYIIKRPDYLSFTNPFETDWRTFNYEFRMFYKTKSEDIRVDKLTVATLKPPTSTGTKFVKQSLTCFFCGTAGHGFDKCADLIKLVLANKIIKEDWKCYLNDEAKTPMILTRAMSPGKVRYTFTTSFRKAVKKAPVKTNTTQVTFSNPTPTTF